MCHLNTYSEDVCHVCQMEVMLDTQTFLLLLRAKPSSDLKPFQFRRGHEDDERLQACVSNLFQGLQQPNKKKYI